MNWGPARDLVESFSIYGRARQTLLTEIGCRPNSMRDPLAEFSEILVERLTGSRRAESPVQKGWDLIDSDGKTTQVRYVANPAGTWVNYHEVRFSAGVDRYALVLFESLEPTRVLIFSSATIADVCRRLGKRHPNQETSLQITQANVHRLRDERHEFARIGVAVFPDAPSTRSLKTTIASKVQSNQTPLATGDPAARAVEFRDDDEGYLSGSQITRVVTF